MTMSVEALDAEVANCVADLARVRAWIEKAERDLAALRQLEGNIIRNIEAWSDHPDRLRGASDGEVQD